MLEKKHSPGDNWKIEFIDGISIIKAECRQEANIYYIFSIESSSNMENAYMYI